MKTPSMSRGLPAQAGFTLIELLIVIAIIAILSGILITNLSGSRAKSRDGKRVSDIAQIQLALEQYFDRCQQYPTAPLDVTADYGCKDAQNNSIKLNNYIAQLPTDPSTGLPYAYVPFAPSGANGPTDYVLRALLETKAAALDDSLRSITNQSTPGWYTATDCYNSATNVYSYCIGPR